jgi:hypothetical protein
MNETDWKKFHSHYDDASPEAQEQIQAILREYGVTYRDVTEEEADSAGSKIADILRLDKAKMDTKKRSLTSMLRLLREAGWMVAVHNDYRQDGKLFTFWMFTHTCGKFLKGEAERDEDAVGLVFFKVYR